MAVAAVLLLAWILLVAWHVMSARSSLSDATARVDQLQNSLEAGDATKASSELDTLSSQVSDAKKHLGGLSVTLASKLPFVGKNVSAVRTVTDAIDSVAQEGLPPIVKVAAGLDPSTFSPRDGRVDVTAIAQLSSPLARLNSSLAAADQDVSAIKSGGLLGPVKNKIVEAQDKIGHAASLARRGSIAADVLPKMLGADGTKQYLLMFQNNAEIRAAGGLPGAFAVITAKDGKIELGRQGSGEKDLADLPSPVATLSPEEKTLFKGGVSTFYDQAMASDLRYTNYTPDFPRTSELAAAILKKKTGITVDGVLALDPVTLGYILRATGPVTLEDGTEITSSNAVSVLLNKAYVDIPVPLQDAFFASAADKIFDKVTSGAGKPTETLNELTRAANEDRLLVWSDSSDIQEVLATTQVGGVLAQQDRGAPRIGTYLNDAGGGKIEYYLRYHVSARSTGCSEAGQQTYQQKAELTSTLPKNFASLPDYIVGFGNHVARGTMLLRAYIYAPARGSISDVRLDGKKVSATTLEHDGRPVSMVTVTLKAGQTAELTSTIGSGKNQAGDTQLDVTPSIETGTKSSVIQTSCS